MQTDLASETATPAQSALGFSRLAHDALLFLALGALWFVLCRHLSAEWSYNEQYSYGWFVPFFAIYLFWLRWEKRPGMEETRNAKRETQATKHGSEKEEQFAICDSRFAIPDKSAISNQQSAIAAIAIAAFALFPVLPVRLFEIGNPDWRPLAWLHAASVVVFTLLALWAAGGKVWVRHFAFPVVFIFIAVPWVTPIETPLVQGLMRFVAAIATEMLTLFGIPAQVEGNLIRVSTGLVGINEACSGVRSLQTSLMIGLLFGELKMLSVSRRILLVAGALALALLANIARAFFLVWIAVRDGVSAIGHWHDIAGYSIIAIVALGSIAMASWLGRKVKSEKWKGESATAEKIEKGKVEGTRTVPPQTSFSFRSSTFHFPLSTFSFALVLLWLIAVEIAVEAWYRLHERHLIPRAHWTVRWPESAPGFRELPIDETTQRILRFDEGRAVVWRSRGELIPTGESALIREAASRSSLRCLFYFFRWNPGTTTILRARAHRPDICLPSTGWKQLADNGARFYPLTGDLEIPFRHFEFVHEAMDRPQFAHTFFCVREDWIRSNADRDSDSVSGAVGGWSIADRWRVVREGIRNLGQQLVEVVVISAQRIETSDAENVFAEAVKDLIIAPR